MAINCTTNPVNGCVSCPSIQATPARPAVVITQADSGWNAGATSIERRTGNFKVRGMQFPESAGAVVIGLREPGPLAVAPDRVTHGFAALVFEGVAAWRVIERGVYKTAAVVRGACDTFEIRRYGGQVAYVVNDSVRYVSEAASTGLVILNACLFTSGDAVGVLCEA